MATRTSRMIAALAVAALGLTACSSDGDDAATDESGEATTTDAAGDHAVESFEAPADDTAGPLDDGASLHGDADAEAADGDEAAGDIAEPMPPEPEPRPGVDTVVFDDHGVSGWIDTAQQTRSTFQTDADIASFRIAESWLTSGILPPPEGIRAEEWINAVDHDHPAPADGEVWRVTADAGDPWWQTGPEAPAATRLLRVGLRAEDLGERPPASLTFVIDVSGSMEYDGRLDSVVEVVSEFLDRLGPQDQVGIVTFSDHAEVVAEHTNDIGLLKERLASLRPSASTNTGAGTILGHERAAAAHRPGDNSAVVVLADGMANRGIVEADRIVAELDRVESAARIPTHTVGIGREVYNDALLEQLANVSGGTYAYIDGPEHAERVFTRDLPLLSPVAHDVKAQVSFDPSTVRSWRLIGYENRMIAAEDFRDDTVAGSYVGAGHEVTAIYELDLQVEGTGGSLGAVDVRWADPTTREVAELRTPLDASLATGAATSRTWDAAAGMAALVETLRHSPYAVVDLEQTAQRLESTDDPQQQWLAGLVRAADAAAQGASPGRQPAPTP